MVLPILYSFRRCPYAMRARMALLASRTAVELREVSLKDKPEEMRIASPKATVPVLVLPDGSVIDESLAVMRWALERNDPEAWLANEKAAMAIIATIDGPFKRHLDRYKYHTRYEDADPLAHREAASSILRDLDARIARKGQLCGDGRSLADIASFPFVRQFAATDRNWFDAQPWPALRIWLDRHIGSDLFKRAMVKHAPWQPGDPAIEFA